MFDKDQVGSSSAEEAASLSDQPAAVVGIGVCGASFDSLDRLFSTIGFDLGAVYLVAVAQKEELDVGSVVEMLKRRSPLSVKLAADGDPLRSNRIYVGGRDDMVLIEDGHVRIRPATEPVGSRGTVDTMLISVAEHARHRTVAVILAGLGSDGTAGVTATKKFGGLSIAEIASESEEGGNGRIGPKGVADLHLSVGDIADQIALYVAGLDLVDEGQGEEEVAEQIDAQVRQVTTILRNVTGHDFHGYKRGTFVRRL